MKALALFGTLVAAKLLAVAGRELPWSVWTPCALFWQDALVALLFAAIDFALRRKPAASWSLYWLIVGYAAVNVPITRILSSPFTWQMSHATGGALSDSITHYLSPATFAQMTTVLFAAIAFAFCAQRSRPAWTKTTFGAFTVLALGGGFAAQRVDCSGLHRNALVAFIDSALPHVQGSSPKIAVDWRASVVGVTTADDLTSMRGAAAGRNVVLVSLESTGSRYLRCYGAKEDPTPNLTRLAENSLVFEHAYAVTPESIKGLFSVLCSRYPAFDTSGENYASVRTASIAQRLASDGYHTALFHSGRFMYLGMNAVIQHRGFETLEDAGAIGGNFNSSFGVDEPATVERMLAWIDKLPTGQRFFLHYLPIAGHHPYATPERGPFPESDDAGQYLNALHYGDAALGKFLDALRHRGLDTNTLFVIYGDHGEAFGQHEGNYGHTLFIYEENIRVPLMVWMPGALSESKRSKRMASLIDLAPTVLDLLGLPVPPDFQGTSLLADDVQRASLFFTDYSLPLAGIRDDKWKLIAELNSSRMKLFDIEADPGETRNLAEQHPELIATWKRRLHNWASAQKSFILPLEGRTQDHAMARAHNEPSK
jgi:phosphoglycerol transferase MdoB-like AlkP superfamily enzyme